MAGASSPLSPGPCPLPAVLQNEPNCPPSLFPGPCPLAPVRCPLFFKTNPIWRWALLLTLSGGLAAQTPTGELRLEVRDSSGAAVEAAGKLVSLNGGGNCAFQTDTRGAYTFTNLDLGRYRIEVSKIGFATQSIVIEVRSATAVARTIMLDVARASYRVDVTATTPLPGTDLALQDIPSPVQVASERDIEHSGALDLSDFLNRRLSGVHVNEVQNNPFQPDVNYRGYTASPLLGTPQGLSIYMDGVRLNQPFGDVVSWDLIPRIAIAEVALMPGSNPLFGLNTLGGALSLQTKDGASRPGTSVQVSGGSFARRAAELEHGGSNRKGLNWYIAGNLFHEDGWREASPSDVRQAFSKLGWSRDKTVLTLTAAFAENSLRGNALQEQRLLARDYSSVYTKPDITDNHSPFFNLAARHSFSRTLIVAGNAYFRYIRTTSSSGDINDDSLDQAVYQPNAAEQAALARAGYTGYPLSGATAANTPFPFWRCIAQVLLRDEPAEKCNGLLNRSRSKQHNSGVSGQLTWFSNGSSGATRNQFTLGTAFDRSSVGFTQSTELGYLNPDRSITGVGAFGDGVTGGSIDGEPFDTAVDLRGVIHTGSIFATNTLSIGNAWSLTASGRYNRTTIDNRDRIRPIAGSGSLTSQNVFDRFNPAIGITYNPARAFHAYFSYSEGSRTPTSVELGCADPNQPCKLPNALAGDPPLRQVVTRTLEAGVRGGTERRLGWSAGWFRANSDDDLLFVASTQSGFGYFRNFGQTRRQGFDLDLNARLHRVTLGAGYTFLSATYRSPEIVNGASNSSNAGGVIQIMPGNRIPLIPRNVGKLFAEIEATSKFTIDLGVLALSSSFARGNEDNLHQAAGPAYLGPGKSPGYAVVNLGARYQLHPRVQLFVQINNLFDRQYYSAAQLGPTGFTADGNFIARPLPVVGGEFPLVHATFYAPGAPLGAWGGIRVKF